MAVNDVMRLQRHVSLASGIAETNTSNMGAHQRFPTATSGDIFSSSHGVFGAFAKEAKKASAAAVSGVWLCSSQQQCPS